MRENKGQISVQEAGKKGGQRTSKQYGPEFYHEIGTKGGKTTSREYGPEFYHKIGTKGGNRVKRLIEQGKKSEK